MKKELKILISIMIAFCVIIFIISLVISKSEQKLRKEKTTLEQKVINQQKIIEQYKTSRVDLREDCEDEQQTVIKRHIEIYIKKRYSKTPRVIAKAIAKNIVFYSKKYNLPPELILGIMEIESMFNPLTESSKGAKGLMQVMPEWAPKLGLKDVNDLHEINIGIESGIKVFLIHLEEADGNISGGLYRYVNKDHSYVSRVYSSVGRFVTYRTTLDIPEKLSKKESNDSSNKQAKSDNRRNPDSDIS